MHGTLDQVPEGARCIFTSQFYRVWAWDQKEFDGNTAIYEVAERVPVFWAIAVVGDKILLQEEVHSVAPNQPFLSLPGGKGLFDEEPLEGTKRELSEESGYESSDWIFYKKEQESYKILWPSYMYIARNARKTHESHPDGGEKITPQLLSLEEFFELDKNPKFRGMMLRKILAEFREDVSKKEEFISLLGISK